MLELLNSLIILVLIWSLPGFVLYFKNTEYTMYSIKDFKDTFDLDKLNKFGVYTFKYFMLITIFVNFMFWKIIDGLNYTIKKMFFKSEKSLGSEEK